MEAPTPGSRFDPHHPRFSNPCGGRKADPQWRCGELHDCPGHARDRDDENNPIGPWRPCRRERTLGSAACATHGGAAPQTIAAAQRRLEALAVPAVERIDRAIREGTISEALRAANSVLDRLGLRKLPEPADLLEIIQRNPHELRRLLEAIDSDPDLAAAIDALDEIADDAPP